MRTYKLTLMTKDEKGTWQSTFIGHHQGSREGAERRASQTALTNIGVSTRWRWQGKGQARDSHIIITDDGPATWDHDYTEGKV